MGSVTVGNGGVKPPIPTSDEAANFTTATAEPPRHTEYTTAALNFQAFWQIFGKPG